MNQAQDSYDGRETIERLRSGRHGGPDAEWTTLSEHRFQSPHPSGASIIAVDAFGELLSQGCRAGDESETFARLIEHAARSAAHRMACEEGTPIVRPNDAANAGVVGCCWWCGRFAFQHTDATPDAVS